MLQPCCQHHPCRAKTFYRLVSGTHAKCSLFNCSCRNPVQFCLSAQFWQTRWGEAQPHAWAVPGARFSFLLDFKLWYCWSVTLKKWTCQATTIFASFNKSLVYYYQSNCKQNPRQFLTHKCGFRVFCQSNWGRNIDDICITLDLLTRSSNMIIMLLKLQKAFFFSLQRKELQNVESFCNLLFGNWWRNAAAEVPQNIESRIYAESETTEIQVCEPAWSFAYI